MKRVLAWLAWWLPLFWLWLLLVGVWNGTQLAAAAIAATFASGLAEFARARTGFSAWPPLRALADVPQVLLAVFVDFGIVIWALLASVARGEVVRGSFRSRGLSRGARDARGVGPRAWVALAASYSPNAYVVAVDPDGADVLLHDLVPREPSERPA